MRTRQTWGNESFPPRRVAEAVNFACLGEAPFAEQLSLNNPVWKPFDCINGLRAQVHFPTCWDGLNLYLRNNSHVAHLNQIDNGICPPDYPYQLPHLFLETLYGKSSACMAFCVYLLLGTWNS